MSEPIRALHTVVPAAGVGRRMGAEVPKQYLPLRGRCIIEHSIERLLALPQVESCQVVLSEDDPVWATLALSRDPRLQRVSGGEERVDSVRRGLAHLHERGVSPEAWVLVHDAARPCVAVADIERLLQDVAEEVGGLLACPVRDTMKRADEQGRVACSVPREQLWHALTPQVFRLGPLLGAIDAALAAGHPVTDEASAMEFLGHRPRLVESSANNLKITRPADLALAERILESE